MACPRARFILVLSQSNVTAANIEKLLALFDELHPVAKAVHDAELHTLRLDADVERHLMRTGPAIEGYPIAVIRKIEGQ